MAALVRDRRPHQKKMTLGCGNIPLSPTATLTTYCKAFLEHAEGNIPLSPTATLTTYCKAFLEHAEGNIPLSPTATLTTVRLSGTCRVRLGKHQQALPGVPSRPVSLIPSLFLSLSLSFPLSFSPSLSPSLSLHHSVSVTCDAL